MATHQQKISDALRDCNTKIADAIALLVSNDALPFSEGQILTETAGRRLGGLEKDLNTQITLLRGTSDAIRNLQNQLRIAREHIDTITGNSTSEPAGIEPGSD